MTMGPLTMGPLTLATLILSLVPMGLAALGSCAPIAVEGAGVEGAGVQGAGVQGGTPGLSPHRLEDRRPLPSDLLGDAWVEDNGLERKRWIAGMHRAAPGTDWRAVERENAERELARRSLEGSGAAGAGTWEEVGSRNQAGQTRCAALGPPGPDGGCALYVGSANGGLWRSDLSGGGWVPLSDALFGGVDEVLALAGDGGAPRGRGDILLLRRGRDLFRSPDGGGSWEVPTGLKGLVRVHRSVKLADEQATLLLLADVATPEGVRTALLASTDRAGSFVRRWTAELRGAGDLWVPRLGEPSRDHLWLVLAGAVRASVDSGHTFGPPVVLDGRARAARLAGSEAGGPRLYAALEVEGAWLLYRSDDGGRSFAPTAELVDFWGPLAAFPGDPDVVLYGGVEGHRSLDGGRTFERINAWGQYYGDPRSRLHADLRGLTVVPDPRIPGRDLCFFSTDGGTYVSTDRGATVVNISLDGLGVAQVYSTLSSASDPDLILVGTQDQGFQRGRRRPSPAGGPSTPFDQMLSGDYGYLTSSDGTHALVYCTYPGFVLVQEGEREPNLLYPWIDFPEGAEHAWLPPIVADPSDPESFFFLADHLYRYSRRRGPYWSFARHSHVDFAAGEGRHLTALAFAPSDPRRAYAANDAGDTWWSGDGGRTWSESRVGAGPYLRPTAIAVHPSDPDRAVVGGSGYSGPGVLATQDGGRSWRPAERGLPHTLVLDLAFDSRGEVLYAATEAGAYRCRLASGRWENLMGRSAPATTYWSVEVVAPDVARFGTYGRGIWDWRPGFPLEGPLEGPAEVPAEGPAADAALEAR